MDEYLSDELASDSEDEKKIRQAKARVARKKKGKGSRNKPYQRRQKEDHKASGSNDFFSWLWGIQ